MPVLSPGPLSLQPIAGRSKLQISSAARYI